MNFKLSLFFTLIVATITVLADPPAGQPQGGANQAFSEADKIVFGTQENKATCRDRCKNKIGWAKGVCISNCAVSFHGCNKPKC